MRPLGKRGVWKVAHLGAVNIGLPTGENALQYAWSLSLNIICSSAQNQSPTRVTNSELPIVVEPLLAQKQRK